MKLIKYLSTTLFNVGNNHFIKQIPFYCFYKNHNNHKNSNK